MALSSADPRRVLVESAALDCPVCGAILAAIPEAGSLYHSRKCGRCGLTVRFPIVSLSAALRRTHPRRK